jgi:hypothetical protein
MARRFSIWSFVSQALSAPTVIRSAAGIVARRRHAVMRAQRLVAARQILRRVGVKIAEIGRQAVAAMLPGNAAQEPQGVLQSLGQRHKTFTAEHDMGVFEAGKGKTEVIEPMIERLAGDGDVKIAHVGEVGQSHPARRMLLTEDHLLIRAVQPPPRSDAPLQRPPDPGAEFRMPADQFLENGDGPQPRRGFQNGDDLVVPNVGERIGPTPLAGLLLL